MPNFSAGETDNVEMDRVLSNADYPELWKSTPDDPLPDTITLDTLLDYCGKSKAEMTISLYMLTREMIESGMQVLPLATYEPYLYCELCHAAHIIL